MAHGIDSRLAAQRQVGPGSSLHQQIQAKTAAADYMFGVQPGTKDDGAGSIKRPLPGSVAPYKGVHESFGGAPGSRPVFHGKEPNEIKLAQMNDNYDKAMAGLMRDEPDNAPMGNLKMVDMGMRESDGKDHPVHTHIDETIKLKK